MNKFIQITKAILLGSLAVFMLVILYVMFGFMGVSDKVQDIEENAKRIEKLNN